MAEWIVWTVLVWMAVFGIWPLADPGHSHWAHPLVTIDLILHFGATWALGTRLARVVATRERP